MMDRLQIILQAIEPASKTYRQKAQERIAQLLMPPKALGELLTLGTQLWAIRASEYPETSHKRIFLFGADHGVCAQGISAFGAEVTAAMMRMFAAGKAAINVLARSVGAELTVVDVGVKGLDDTNTPAPIERHKIRRGTADMSLGPAMSPREAISAIEVGLTMVERFSRQTDLFVTGDMGIGNTTASSAIVAALTGRSVAEVTGAGSGLDEQKVAHKVAVIERAIAVNRPDGKDGLDVLHKVGGLEIAAMCGLILGAAAVRKPVVIDGFISGAAALLAWHLAPACLDYMVFGHLSKERGHKVIINELGVRPLLDLNLGLGEGSGAALTLPLIDASVKILSEMGTFADLESGN